MELDSDKVAVVTGAAELAVDRFHHIGEAQDPQIPEEVPGMPPQSEVLAEVMAAMAQAVTTNPDGS